MANRTRGRHRAWCDECNRVFLVDCPAGLRGSTGDCQGHVCGDCYKPDDDEPTPPGTESLPTSSGGCRCGSGMHPRRCDVHPGRYAEHCREISEEAAEDAPTSETKER